MRGPSSRWVRRVGWLVPVLFMLDAAAAEPLGSAFAYQGSLESSGSPLDGPADFRFDLYDAPAGGTQVGSTVSVDAVAVAGGAFTVSLDFGTGPFDGQARWLEIAVRVPAGSGAFVVLAPRQEITVTPYALAVRGVDGHSLDASDGSPTDVVYVDAAGRVGVGTQAPGSRVEVRAGSLGDGIRVAGTAPNDPAFHLYDGSTPRGALGLALQAGVWSTSASPGDVVLRAETGKLHLQTSFLEAGITVAGNRVGIGTAAPTEKLEVRGNLRLGSGGELFAPGAVENVRVVRGLVSAGGIPFYGTGFSSTIVSPGVYTITFATPFASEAAITVTPTRGNPPYPPIVCAVDATFTGSVTVRTYDLTGTPVHSAFHFIAVGPR